MAQLNFQLLVFARLPLLPATPDTLPWPLLPNSVLLILGSLIPFSSFLSPPPLLPISTNVILQYLALFRGQLLRNLVSHNKYSSR